VFGWEERAHESSRYMREEIERRTAAWTHVTRGDGRPVTAADDAAVANGRLVREGR
jgi:hypothetical protein